MPTTIATTDHHSSIPSSALTTFCLRNYPHLNNQIRINHPNQQLRQPFFISGDGWLISHHHSSTTTDTTTTYKTLNELLITWPNLFSMYTNLPLIHAQKEICFLIYRSRDCSISSFITDIKIKNATKGLCRRVSTVKKIDRCHLCSSTDKQITRRRASLSSWRCRSWFWNKV